jgi:hypothetical protein
LPPKHSECFPHRISSFSVTAGMDNAVISVLPSCDQSPRQFGSDLANSFKGSDRPPRFIPGPRENPRTVQPNSVRDAGNFVVPPRFLDMGNAKPSENRPNLVLSNPPVSAKRSGPLLPRFLLR